MHGVQTPNNSYWTKLITSFLALRGVLEHLASYPGADGADGASVPGYEAIEHPEHPLLDTPLLG